MPRRGLALHAFLAPAQETVKNPKTREEGGGGIGERRHQETASRVSEPVAINTQPGGVCHCGRPGFQLPQLHSPAWGSRPVPGAQQPQAEATVRSEAPGGGAHSTPALRPLGVDFSMTPRHQRGLRTPGQTCSESPVTHHGCCLE